MEHSGINRDCPFEQGGRRASRVPHRAQAKHRGARSSMARQNRVQRGSHSWPSEARPAEPGQRSWTHRGQLRQRIHLATTRLANGVSSTESERTKRRQMLQRGSQGFSPVTEAICRPARQHFRLPGNLGNYHKLFCAFFAK